MASSDVTVTTAPRRSNEVATRATWTAALERRLGRSVRLHLRHVDPALIGGAVLRAGDLMIDGSLRGRL